MLRPFQWLRLLKIKFVLLRYCLTPTVLGQQSTGLRIASYLNPYSYVQPALSRGVAFRLVCETLGPVFIKFGQLLSTRPDLLPEDIVVELEKLQDQVPPFDGAIAKQMIEQMHHCTINQLFTSFDEEPLASASVAQVHAATLADGSAVVVKILRPKIATVIRQDIAILYCIAKLAERFWLHGKRLRPVALVAEFEHTIMDELDLAREAASASQLRRNFYNSPMMYVPKIYWDYVHTDMLVMERISGVRISDISTLHQRHTNMKKLAEYGVEIFFTQLFRDNFFHADMHPGNLFVDISDPENPKYIGVDFGIMGSLSPFDQRYLAENLLAFFDRDYHRVAMLHVESGWVPADTRIDQMEAAIRTVCEPIFEKPLREISLGKLLLRLFVTAERFNMQIQPQLMLLQKTLLSIEGLGRQLYPQLNLWETAQPLMQRWIKQEYSLKKLAQLAKQDWPEVSEQAVHAPKLILNLLQQLQQRWQREGGAQASQQPVRRQSYRQSRRQGVLLGVGLALVVIVMVDKMLPGLGMRMSGATSSVLMISIAAVCGLCAWIMKQD